MAVGYDNIDINHNLVLDLPHLEGGGVITRDQSKNHYLFTLTGTPAWYNLPATGINMLDYTAATPDFLEAAIADVGDLDFTSEDFTLNFWINPDTIAGDVYLMCHGLAGTEGYTMRVLAGGGVHFSSHQAGATQDVTSALGTVIIGRFQNIGISRSGTLLQIIKNGIETAYVAQDDITDPLASARKVLFGVYDDEAADPYSQYISRPRAWLNRQLAVEAHRFIWETERHWYGE